MERKPLRQALAQPGTRQALAAPRDGINHAIEFGEYLLMFMAMLVIAGETLFAHQRLFLREMVFTVKLQLGERKDQLAGSTGTSLIQQYHHLVVESIEGRMIEDNGSGQFGVLL